MNGGQKFYGLDHLRAFAIIYVLLFHYQLPFFGHPLWLERVAQFGWTGVDLFFVLSGFLISSQLFADIRNERVISFRIFFIKRCFRILPAYWFVLLIYFFIPFFREREALPPLWKLLTFMQNFGLDLSTQGTFSHAWSLCVEEHFYFILPLFLIFLVNRKMLKYGYIFLLLLFASGFIVRYLLWKYTYSSSLDTTNPVLYWYKCIYYPTYNRLDGLLTGVGIAAIYNFLPATWEKLSRFANVFLTGGMLLLISTFYLFEDTHSHAASVFEFPLVALSYGCIVLAAISPKCILYKLKSRITSWIALLSYGMYLTHKGVIHVTQELLKKFSIDENSAFSMVVSMLMCICAAALLHMIIEEPFMDWRKKIVSQNFL